MVSIKDLKERLKIRIDNLSVEKLNNVSEFIESLESENNKAQLLSVAGSWSDLKGEAIDELTNGLVDRRNNNRSRFL